MTHNGPDLQAQLTYLASLQQNPARTPTKQAPERHNTQSSNVKLHGFSQ